jgi:hypothetical protein
MDLPQCLGVLLKDAQAALKGLPGTGMPVGPRLRWLERQLAYLVSQLQALQIDIEAGCSLSDLGFFGEEGEERMGDLAVEISTLRGMIQTARMIER